MNKTEVDAMETFFDYSDAREILRETRKRETALALEIGEHNPIDPRFVECQGDGWSRNPLLAAPGEHRARQFESVMLSGEIRDGRGYHPMATFLAVPVSAERRESRRDHQRARGEARAVRARLYDRIQSGVAR